MLLDLYKTVAKIPGGLARVESEITGEYISHNLHRSLNTGICLVVANPLNENELVAELHCYKPEPGVFSHVLSELTAAVHPQHQGRGLGKLLFTALLNEVQTNRKDIRRIELIARESNTKAIELYKQMGFVVEGRMEGRIANPDGTYEADVPMGWSLRNATV
jgi:ribosomal protein S18 acetylase RimI-like enzyme